MNGTELVVDGGFTAWITVAIKANSIALFF
jgi:hypothetical protein